MKRITILLLLSLCTPLMNAQSGACEFESLEVVGIITLQSIQRTQEWALPVN